MPTVYHGHLRGPVTLTSVAERLAVELSLPVFTTQVCRDRGSNPDLPACEANALPLRRLSFKYQIIYMNWMIQNDMFLYATN